MACITLWVLEAPARATKCAWHFVGEIWELERTAAPHLSTGEPVDAEANRWSTAGTLEGIEEEAVRVDVLESMAFELEATNS